MKLVDANSDASVEGIDPLPGKVNYLIGDNPERWRTNVPTCARVVVREAYPGVDVVYYGNGRRLEYDFVVAPGADPAAIRLAFEGAEEMRIESDGDLVLKASGGEIRHHKPLVYQEADGERVTVPAGFERVSEHEVAFSLGAYDPDLPLVIDPSVAVSTFLGGSGDDSGHGIAVDSEGYIYLTGTTKGAGFPAVNALQGVFQGTAEDVFVTKLDPTGTQIIYSTYLGGTNSGNEGGWDIAVDDEGAAYIAGQTNSPDFPGTADSPIQSEYYLGAGGFITKLSPAGDAIVWSTHYDHTGFDRANGIAVDAQRNVYVTSTTRSTTLPGIDASSIQPVHRGQYDVAVTKINAAGTQVLWATYLGGSEYELPRDIDVDAAGNVYVTGFTNSADFPTANAMQPTMNGQSDFFLAKIDAAGTQLVYSTYLGGNGGDGGKMLSLLSDGSVLVIGSTNSTDFPGTASSAIQASFGGGDNDVAIAQVDASGQQILFATYLGGSDREYGMAVGVDAEDRLYATGYTTSPDFPALDLSLLQPGASADNYFVRINADRTAIEYSALLGGTGPDPMWKALVGPTGIVYATGFTRSTDMPVVNAVQPAHGGGQDDAFLAIILPDDKLAPGFELLDPEGEVFALCGDTVPWATGRELVLDVRARDINIFDAVQLDAVELVGGAPIPLPPGATWELRQTGNPAVGRLRWTPADAEEGPRVFRFTALDSSGLTSTCEITLVLTFDRDGDGLRDLHELDGYDAGGIHVDLPGLGADVDHKDLFVYVDYMSGAQYDHRPSDWTIQQIVGSFANAPLDNPDGFPGINLHVRVQSTPTQVFVEHLGTGNGSGNYRWTRETPVDPEIFFDDIKNGLPGTLDEHFPTELRPAMRYCLFAHLLADLTDSGLARGAPSSDLIVSLGAFALTEGAPPHRPPDSVQAGTFMHELGHVLGLNHGGQDKTNYKPGYLSVMNYTFQKGGLLVGGSPRFDYSRFPDPSDADPARLDLNENALDEGHGLGNWPDSMAGYQTAWYVLLVDSGGKPIVTPTGEFQYEIRWSNPFDPAGDNSVDWDNDGYAAGLQTFSINQDLYYSSLRGHNDWSRISFKGGTVGAGAPPELPPVTPVEELDIEEALVIRPAPPQGLAARSGRGMVRLSWIPAGPRGEVKYHLFRKVKGAPGDAAELATTTSTLYADRGVARRTTYEYVVTVEDALGVLSDPSSATEVTVR